MGLMDFIRGELIEILEFNDDSRDTISWRFPDSDREIKRGAQLIVRESQIAQFVYLGQFGDTFTPGKHTLVTDNIPVLSTLKGWKYGFESPFKADVYFINTRLFTGNKWGTANPIMMRDQDFGIVRLRAFGTYDFRVVEPRLFLKEVVGTDQNFRVDEFAETMRSRLVSIFADSLATAKIPALDIASRYTELGEALLPIINPIVAAKYGIEIPSFILENVSVPPEVEEAIDKRSSMSAVGNLNDYVKYQMGQGMGKGARRRRRHGGRTCRRLRHRAADDEARRLDVSCCRRAFAGSRSDGTARSCASSSASLKPTSWQQSLRASLKAKKIGSQYRITKAALDAFLAE